MERIIVDRTYEFIKTFKEDDVLNFARLSEDDNPIHTDEAYASQTIFKQRVVHGIFLVSMFSKIFGTQFPGKGGIYLSQTAKFMRPAFVGNTIRAVVRLTSFDNVRKHGVFITECFNEKNELLVSGQAEIKFPKQFNL